MNLVYIINKVINFTMKWLAKRKFLGIFQIESGFEIQKQNLNNNKETIDLYGGLFEAIQQVIIKITNKDLSKITIGNDITISILRNNEEGYFLVFLD